MNTKVFFLAPAVLALSLFSCSENTVNSEKEKTAGNLSVVATKGNVVTYSDSGDIVVFTGDDIETYNGKTGRIVFKDLTYDDLFRRTENNFTLKFYLDDEFLFDILLLVEPGSMYYDVPVLTASRGDEYVPDKFFLLDGYPMRGQKSFFEQFPAWGKFIQYLTDSGKLTEVADPVTPPVQKVPDEIITAISADDIKSYNLSTGEIVFTGFTVQDLLERRIGIQFGVTDCFHMPFYLGEKLLFEAVCVGPFSSIPYYYDLTFTWYDDKFYLSDGYPAIEDWESLPWPDKDKVRRLREENAQTRKAEWDIFIKYLRDAGKLVE